MCVPWACSCPCHAHAHAPTPPPGPTAHLAVEEQVAVVPILDAEDVADDRIGGEGADEVGLGGGEGGRSLRAVGALKVRRERREPRLALQPVERARVGDHLYQPRRRAGGEDVVRAEVERGGEDGREEGDGLRQGWGERVGAEGGMCVCLGVGAEGG